jgi:cell division septation protein DedD
MSSASNKTSRPAMGQRPMFGGGNPAFARMPSYTPVTRGHDQAPRPEPQPAPYPSQSAAAYPSANPPQPYPNGRQQAPSQPYGSPQQSGGAPQAYPASNAYPPQGQGNAYPPQGQGHPYPPQGQGNNFPGQAYSGQGYAAPNYAPQGYPAQTYPQQGKREENFDSTFADSNFSDASYPDASFPEQNFSEPSYSPSGFAGYPESAPAPHADASFPETGYTEDASFPEDTSYAGAAYPHNEPLSLDGGYGQPQAYQPYHDPGQHGGMTPQGGQPPSDPHRALQPFDAPYDQPPQISLGGEPARHGAHGFYEDDQSDADFLDDGDALAAAAVAQSARKGGMTLRSRSMFMVGSALLGAVALGGALAFAYKQSGGAMNGDQPPLVQADNRPVKEVPDQPGGKDFPHKNKLIYDRLENGDKPETDHLVPRQEEVAMPAMPGSGGETAGLPAQQGAPQTTQAVDGNSPPAVATVDDPEGGPRRVKTMVVRPDGSMAPPPPGVEAAAAPAPQAAPAQQVASAQVPGIVATPPAAPAPQAALAPQPAPAPVAAAAAPEPRQVASIPAPAKPKPVKAAAVAPAAPAKPSAYVVQVGSKKNQTEALATFADMQQKYPTLLSSYRPMVQKADLGSKGVWYRLRIGPMNDKTAASKLCTQLKSQGLSDCLVMTE